MTVRYGKAGRLLAAAAVLAAFVRRNVYGTVAAEDGRIEALGAYIARQEAHLAGLADAPLLAGTVAFLAVPAGPAPCARGGAA